MPNHLSVAKNGEFEISQLASRLASPPGILASAESKQRYRDLQKLSNQTESVALQEMAKTAIQGLIIHHGAQLHQLQAWADDANMIVDEQKLQSRIAAEHRIHNEKVLRITQVAEDADNRLSKIKKTIENEEVRHSLVQEILDELASFKSKVRSLSL